MGYILVGTIIGGIIWGIVVNKVVENKGYKEDWFWWGFFFGIFALIIALTKQSVNTTKVVIESSAPVKENMELLSSCILNNQVNISSPVHIASWEIKKDTEKLVLFVDFMNVSQKAISAVMFSATGFNSFGDIVRVNDADLFDVMGQDLSIKPNECGRVYATLQDDAIRKVELKVKKVCFLDGTIADDIQDEWVNANQFELNSIHIDCARRENAQSKYYAIIKEHYWQCVCGFVNTQNTCAICSMQKNNALKFTQENIEDAYNKYLKQIEIERLEEETRRQNDKRLEEEKRKLTERQVKVKKKIAIITSLVILFSVICGVVFNKCIYPKYEYNKKYNEALELMRNLKHSEAACIFLELNRDEEYLQCLNLYRESISEYSELLATGASHTVGIMPDGTVVSTGDNHARQCEVLEWTDIVKLAAGDYCTLGIKSNGDAVATGFFSSDVSEINNWKDIKKISSDGFHIVGLKTNGSVVAVGENESGECDVSDWHNIVDIAAGAFHTVGLKSNNTVVAIGSNNHGQTDVSHWKNIVALSSDSFHTIGLQSNGKVVATGTNEEGQCNVSKWENIVAISTSDSHTVGLKMDGTVVACGDNFYGQCNVSKWNDIVAISAGDGHTVGLKKDGSLVSIGYIDISDWDLLD